MRVHLLRFVRAAILPTVALVAVLAIFPGRSRVALHVYALVLCGLALLRLVDAIRRAHPPARSSAFERALRRPARRIQRLEELEALEREIMLATGSAFDFHFRLRPALRATATQLLAIRRGVDLDASPDAARRLLGEEAFALVRSDRELPQDRHGPGVRPVELRALVDALEAL